MQALTSYLALALCLVGFCAAVSVSPCSCNSPCNCNSPVVVPSGCPNGCPRHEHCGSGNGIAGCDNNLCSTLQMKYVGVFHVCPFFARQMCVCDDGYLRDDNGKCVLKKDCPCKCNEQRPTCGNVCGQTCDTVDDMCTMDCQSVQPGQCSCKSGYVRCTDVSFECVPVEICYALKAATTPTPTTS